jgi:hypothetical protein
MSDTLTYQQTGTTARGQTHIRFGQTMGYVAATAAALPLFPEIFLGSQGRER